MKSVGSLWFKAIGNHEIVEPKLGETVDHLYKRLHRLARSYRRWGRAFRVEQQNDGVLWWRVEPGEHTKLARWYRLPPGEPYSMIQNAGKSELRKAQATARYLRRAGKGAYVARLVDGHVMVTRCLSNA